MNAYIINTGGVWTCLQIEVTFYDYCGFYDALLENAVVVITFISAHFFWT